MRQIKLTNNKKRQGYNSRKLISYPFMCCLGLHAAVDIEDLVFFISVYLRRAECMSSDLAADIKLEKEQKFKLTMRSNRT